VIGCGTVDIHFVESDFVTLDMHYVVSYCLWDSWYKLCGERLFVDSRYKLCVE